MKKVFQVLGVFVLFGLVAGCTSRQPATIVEHASEKSPPEDARTAEFRAGMEGFVKKAKSVTRMMQLFPDQESYAKQVESVQEAFSQIPDPPPGDKLSAAYYKASKQIAVNFNLGTLFLKEYATLFRMMSHEGCDAAREGFRASYDHQLADVKELESALNEGRFPKVELSDKIKGQK